MKRYFIHRLLLLLPTLFGALSLVFLLVHLIPGDPVEVMLGETASGADKQELRRSLGLDQPLATQYRSFLSKLVTGDLGRSLFEQASVGEIIGQRLPATIELALCAMIAALVISFPLAFIAARRPGGIADRFALLFSLLGLSRERLAVRLALTLHYADSAVQDTASNWRGSIEQLLAPVVVSPGCIDLPVAPFSRQDYLLGVAVTVALLVAWL